jgi:magnesium transporter
MWMDGELKELSLDNLKASFNQPSWINLSDLSVEDLEKVAEALNMSKYILIDYSNYPHIDTYPEYTKIFSWYLSRESPELGLFHRNPIVILTNKVSVITISSSKIGIYEKIIKELNKTQNFSMPTRIIYIIMMYLLESYEFFTEEFEKLAERFEEAVPPWPSNFYTESFNVRTNASRFSRLLKYFRISIQVLAKGKTYVPMTEEDKQLFDVLNNRTISYEESIGISLETIRDLISMHHNVISSEMNQAMRFMAAITSIVAIPSVIGSLLGMNLYGNPWPWELWQIALSSIIIAVLLTIFFYMKGWLQTGRYKGNLQATNT